MQRFQACLNVPAVLLFAAVLVAGCGTTRERKIVKPPELSARQREAMQTRELNGDFATVFAATLSVMQDEGWQIETIDRESGIIQAASLKRQDIIGPHEDWYAERDPAYREKVQEQAAKASKKKQGPGLLPWTRWERLTAHIEPWGKKTVRVRITITSYGTVSSNTYSYKNRDDDYEVGTIGGKEQSVIVDNPVTYKFLFQQIKRAAFVRKGMQGR